MLQIHLCSPKSSLHPTLWLRLRAVVPETAWLCLVVPESTRQQYLQVPGKAWLCLIEPACNVPGTAWQLSFLFHSFLFLVIIHKIVMKLSNKPTYSRQYVWWRKGGVWIITISERMVHYGCHVFIIKDLISLIIVRFDRK